MSDLRRIKSAAEIASLVLANAFIFHSELAEDNPRVVPLHTLLQNDDVKGALVDHWKFIMHEINYVPIFTVAKDVVLNLPERRETVNALRRLAEEVRRVVSNRAALRHDLMGRIYHTLLLDMKYLGTYYTSVAAATLLVRLALDPRRWPGVDFSSEDALGEFRIADPSCGTGTLLMAAQQTVTDNFVRAMISAGKRVTTEDLERVHKLNIEQILNGYDVLASAVHLTASTLAIIAPHITFDKMSLYCLPLGSPDKQTIHLGSIDYATEQNISSTIDLMKTKPIFGTQVTGRGDADSGASLPKLDLCVMNPPFTRSVGGNLLFGSLPPSERARMQTKLRRLLSRGRNSRYELLANSTAGLGSVFIAVVDRYLKDGGRMALVLPEAVAFGIAWEKTRRLFAEKYVVETLIVSHDPARWNFSESTDLSEILIIVRKKNNGDDVDRSRVAVINLWRNSPSPVDSISLLESLKRNDPVAVETGHGVVSLNVAGHKAGEYVSIPWSDIKDDQWYPCAFAQTELNRTAHFLRQGKLYISSAGIVGDVPLTKLSTIGELGPDRRDVYDGFELSEAPTSYPAFWSHDAEHVTSLAMKTNAYLSPLGKPRTGRKLRRIELIWPRAGGVMLAEKMRMNTQRITAVCLDREALSNVWWPFSVTDGNGRVGRAMVLWFNSTFGLLSLLSNRVPTEGPWVQFKKPMYESLKVLDISSLSDLQLNGLSDAYEGLCEETLQPFPEMDTDVVRRAIDETICEILNLPSIERIRSALAREPIITGQPLYQ